VGRGPARRGRGRPPQLDAFGGVYAEGTEALASQVLYVRPFLWRGEVPEGVGGGYLRHPWWYLAS